MIISYGAFQYYPLARLGFVKNLFSRSLMDSSPNLPLSLNPKQSVFGQNVSAEVPSANATDI